ncbi:MAG: aldehyde ferredoxin oxidoreductase C-terminal domain-containing protein, partial [Desulfurococcaceae archaeon]
ASERGLISDKVEWGDFNEVKQLIEDTAYRRGLGDFLAEGTMRMSFKLKGGSEKWAMHVKGLEISAYNCHTAPGMALAYGTSPIGAHHKDAWIIAYEVKSDRMSYSESKVAKLIELQRIRGGIFESITTCRFPWIELGLSLDYYSKLLTHATGITYSLEDLYIVADRIYTLIRALWIREIGGWSTLADYPPARWFEEPLNKGPYAGHKLDLEGYSRMLAAYYDHRGWDERGVPTKGTLAKLGLNYVASELEKYIELK